MTYERELLRTADRLRQLSDTRLRSHEPEFRSVLAAMTGRPVPAVGAHAWGDQLWVVGQEVAPGDQPALIPRLVDLRRSFDLLP
ncbi:MAG TPA: hypothetical protein PLT68_07925 [Actinomycetota bacterium]|nr:hypothetical protein [Actinomycetota bacterium]